MVDALGPEGDEGRGVAAISFGEVPSNLWPEDVRMGKPNTAKQYYPVRREQNLEKWNIPVSRGKENKSLLTIVRGLSMKQLSN